MKIYIATRYTDAQYIHNDIAPAIEAMGHKVMSSWHRPPWGDERLQELPTGVIDQAFRRNRHELGSSDVCLVVDMPGCRETYAEAEAAWDMALQVIWVGKPHLSAELRGRTTDGYIVVPTMTDAFNALRWMADGTPCAYTR